MYDFYFEKNEWTPVSADSVKHERPGVHLIFSSSTYFVFWIGRPRKVSDGVDKFSDPGLLQYLVLSAPNKYGWHALPGLSVTNLHRDTRIMFVLVFEVDNKLVYFTAPSTVIQQRRSLAMHAFQYIALRSRTVTPLSFPVLSYYHHQYAIRFYTDVDGLRPIF